MIKKIDGTLKFFGLNSKKTKQLKLKSHNNSIVLSIVAVFFMIQFFFPFRYFLYPGELFWNEQGYRFSWRVMLIEKKGMTNLKVLNKENGKSFMVMNAEFLTEFQERQMSFQPDFILEYAHHVGEYYKKNGMNEIEIYADSYVTLNKRISTQFIEKDFDLLSTKDSFLKKKWIIPIKDEIKGF